MNPMDTDQQNKLESATLYKQTDSGEFMSRIQAGGETWCHHFEPSSNAASIPRRYSGSPKQTNFRSQATKVMLMAFFDSTKGLLLEDLKEPNAGINANPDKPRRDIENKCIL
ncbi:hypothetical protein HPB48_001068 [Haemaphysalis longicornis]|uniref:Uncharacterized protein n=1 Tax=Haemaphysalis longicornis TaxID=44386 RepID=A0A9J6GY76_HAELO|nr:hypothetical protein HPB48_001068 [Haemaphysalis longicornis]